MTDEEGFVMKYEAGTADEVRLDELIGKAWSVVLSDPQKQAEIAAALNVKETELDPERPPFRAEITGAGLTGGEVLIAAVAAFAIGFAKDMGGAAGKEAAKRLRQVWTDYMCDEVSPPGSGRLGRSKDHEEET
jgi:hypothetical protein